MGRHPAYLLLISVIPMFMYLREDFIECLESLHDRYGRTEMVEATIKKTLDNFPTKKWTDFMTYWTFCPSWNLRCLMLLPTVVICLHFVRNQSHCQQSTLRSSREWTTRALTCKTLYKIPFPPLQSFYEYLLQYTPQHIIALKYQNHVIQNSNLHSIPQLII